MKLTLEVLTAGKMQGKTIPITLSQFIIGRDPQCQLRPASALISKRHCAVLVRNGGVYVRDFDSTNGTFINEQPVKGERELRDADQLKVGPLDFRVHIEGILAVDKPTPIPPTKAPEKSQDDDDAAAMLLSLQDDSVAPSLGTPVDSEGVPTGSTLMEALPNPSSEEGGKGDAKAETDKLQAVKQAQANTSVAAKAILDKYMRRPRS
jgi:predicted component of type VI protein secretion system